MSGHRDGRRANRSADDCACPLQGLANGGGGSLPMVHHVPLDMAGHGLDLSDLAPRKGELLWDIGAGSGSVGIEWMLADPSLRAIAIESEPERAERIARNARHFGVPDLRVVGGAAPSALAGLDAPHAVFVGGGGTTPGVMDAAMSALRPDGRLVANAVSLEMEQALLTLHARHGGELVRLSVAQAVPLGTMSGWRPAMPITQWRWTKA